MALIEISRSRFKHFFGMNFLGDFWVYLGGDSFSRRNIEDLVKF